MCVYREEKIHREIRSWIIELLFLPFLRTIYFERMLLSSSFIFISFKQTRFFLLLFLPYLHPFLFPPPFIIPPPRLLRRFKHPFPLSLSPPTKNPIDANAFQFRYDLSRKITPRNKRKLNRSLPFLSSKMCSRKIVASTIEQNFQRKILDNPYHLVRN